MAEETPYDTEEAIERNFLRKAAENEIFKVEITVKMGNRGILLQMTKEARDAFGRKKMVEFYGERIVDAIDTLELVILKESLNTKETKVAP